MPDSLYDDIVNIASGKGDPNRSALGNPRVKQFLDKIGKSEGADYNTLVGGSGIDDLSRHPNRVGLRTSAGPSTAFGKYQIVGTTDRSKLRKYRHLDYSPANQDVRAVELLRQTGALEALERGDEGEAIRRAGREWASLPGSPLPGRKNHRAFQQSQPVKSDPYADVLKAAGVQPQEQTPPTADPKTRTTPAESPANPAQQPAPLQLRTRPAFGQSLDTEAIRAGVEAFETKPRPKPATGRAGDLFRQLGQQRTVAESQRQREQQVREEVAAELKARRGMAGSPTPRGMLHVIANPVGALTGLFKSDEQQIAEETAERLRQEQIAQTPEVTDIRKEYGRMPAAARSVVAPVARGGAGLLRVGSGIASAFGIAPNRLSDWATKRADIVESGASQAPLTEQRTLSSLINGNPELAEVERGIPEKLATGIADLGVGLGSIILLKRATKLPFNQLLALEAAAKSSDKPADQQLARAAEGYALGTALEKLTSRAANAAISGLPAAAQSGYEVSQGRMSPLDAAIQTGIQTASGAILTPRRRGQSETAQNQQANLPTNRARNQASPIRPEQVAPEVRNAERIASENQVETQPDVSAQRETVEPAARPVPDQVQAGNAKVVSSTGAAVPAEASQRFYHRDFGEVTESPNQRRVGRHRVRVVAEDGSEHVIKRSSMSGAGNIRSVPIREPAADKSLDSYLDPEGTRVPTATNTVTEPAPDSTTAIKNAAMATDRATRDLPELTAAQPRKAAEVHERAIQANAKDPRGVDRLVEQALETSKTYTDVETAQVRLRAQEIKNRETELLNEINSTDDPQVIQTKRLELDSLTDEFDRLSQATRRAGTEWGRAGVARQQAIDQDFSLVAMKARLRADKGDVLSERESREVEHIARSIPQVETKLAEAQSRAIEQHLQKQINRVQRSRQREESLADLDAEFTTLKSQLAQMKAEEGSFLRSERGAVDPVAVKLIVAMAQNRMKAGVTKAAQLIDEIHAAAGGRWTRQEVADTLADNVTTAQDKRRQTQLGKQRAQMEGEMAAGVFPESVRQRPAYNRETLRLTQQVEQLKADYNRMRYKATRGRAGIISDELAKAANVPKTLKSIGDISAMFRQGGFYALTHPKEGLAKPTHAMLRSIHELGWRNVETEIKSDADFVKLRDAGVEFTGVDKADPNLTRREEGFLGGDYLDYVPVAKQVKDFSERTFVSFLDAQRLYVGKQILKGLTEAQRNDPRELKAIAKLINAATGRGSLGRRGNQYAPALNIAMFSPRLVASRIQLLNNMVNPVTMARMPPGARKQMIKDNAKFVGATMGILALAKAAGATVSLDPDDAEFLKVRIGNTVYDQLTGLQQPLRTIINLTRAATPSALSSRTLQTGNFYAGKSMKEILDPFEEGSFTRSKLNPALSPLINYATGTDFMGREFSLKREAKDVALPLFAKDIIEGFQAEGALGSLKATPSGVGIGVGSYPPSPEKPHTLAEKLARKLARPPDGEPRTDTEIETDRERARLRARSRAGENVTTDMQRLLREGRISTPQAKLVQQARGRTRLSEDIKRLSADEALQVYDAMNASEKRVSAASIRQKLANSKADAAKKRAYRERARQLGLIQ